MTLATTGFKPLDRFIRQAESLNLDITLRSSSHEATYFTNGEVMIPSRISYTADITVPLPEHLQNTGLDYVYGEHGSTRVHLHYTRCDEKGARPKRLGATSGQHPHARTLRKTIHIAIAIDSLGHDAERLKNRN